MKTKLTFFFLLSFFLTFSQKNNTAITAVTPFPSFLEIKKQYRTSDLLFLDRNEKPIHRKRIHSHFRQLNWVSLSEISPVFLTMLLLAEDKNFYTHSGVDWVSLGVAAIQNLFSKQKRGASTISMQLASLLEENKYPSSKKKRRNWWQKWNQIQLSELLEQEWSKEQILETYLNLIPFRGELRGITAASEALFQKKPSTITIFDASLLVSLIRQPNVAASLWLERSCTLLKKMEKKQETPLDCNILSQIQKEILNLQNRNKKPSSQFPSLAHHAIEKILNTNPLLSTSYLKPVHTTLDFSLQEKAQEILKKNLSLLKEKNVQDGAILIADHQTGSVLVYIGSSGVLSSAPFVDHVLALRQAGSSLKPFLYALAIENRLLTAATLLHDSPLEISRSTGIYRPQNYDKHFHGRVTVRKALASSLNIPAVQTIQKVGVLSFLKTLASLGFSHLEEEEFYGESLALGAVDLTLWELVQAYTILANQGVKKPLTLIPSTLKQKISPQQIFSQETSFIINHILSDRMSRSETFGFENPLSTRFWTAVKTGTSKDMRDNWCIGFSSHYTVGVWVGNSHGEPMWNVSGVTGAAPIWMELMSLLHQEIPSKEPPPPKNGIRVVRSRWNRNWQQEYFLPGTEIELNRQDEKELHSSYIQPKIQYPSSQSIFAFDPDIPKERQKIIFQAVGFTKEMEWELNGAKLQSKDKIYWPLQRGKFTLTLKNKNRSIDHVSFQVR